MELVMNEMEWAADMIERHDLGDRPTQTLRRVASYYYNNKYGKREIRRLLEIFLVACDPSVSLVKWSDTIDRVVKSVDKRKMIQVDGVEITKPELVKIGELNGPRPKRLAFTLLCIAKYWNQVSKDNNSWVNTPDSDIMRMANIKASIKQQSLLYGKLIDAGLLESAKRVDNLNVRVTFCKKGDVEMHITDFRNLGFQYQRYLGEPFYQCENCGLVLPESDNPKAHHKYCPDCASTIKTKNSMDSVARYRRAQKIAAS